MEMSEVNSGCEVRTYPLSSFEFLQPDLQVELTLQLKV